MKRILVPLNFSTASVNSLRYAVALAKHLGTHLSLLHCYPVEHHVRLFDFGKKKYETGIREMLQDFFKKHIGEDLSKVRFIARKGSISSTIASISAQYLMVVLHGNNFSSNLSRWLSSKGTYIASKAKSPVLIIPFAEKPLEYGTWRKIWHIKRKDNETEIITKNIAAVKIDPDFIEVKSFKQKTFKSIFWQAIVSYVGSRKKELHQAIFDTHQVEKLDLILLVSHAKSTFEKFVKDDKIQVIFKFGIPVLIFQARK